MITPIEIDFGRHFRRNEKVSFEWVGQYRMKVIRGEWFLFWSPFSKLWPITYTLIIRSHLWLGCKRGFVFILSMYYQIPKYMYPILFISYWCAFFPMLSNKFTKDCKIVKLNGPQFRQFRGRFSLEHSDLPPWAIQWNDCSGEGRHTWFRHEFQTSPLYPPIWVSTWKR